MDRSERSDTDNEFRHGRPLRLIEWILFRGNRLAVSGVLLAGLFVFLVGIVAIGVPLVRDKNPLQLLFSTLVGGNLTLITVVLSINQLVLSRQLNAPGELRSQLEEMAEFRSDAAAATDSRAMPVLPPDFMHQLSQAVQRQVRTLDDHSGSHIDTEVQTDLDDLLAQLATEFDRISGLLEQSGTDPFHALTTTLATDLGPRIHQARRIDTLHRESLPKGAQEALDELLSTLELIDVSREYFKTVFMQKELSYLSRVLLYVGIPAELCATGMLVAFSASSDPVSYPFLASIVVPGTVTIGFAPLAVLFSFVLRIATVIERSVAISPFTTPKQVP